MSRQVIWLFGRGLSIGCGLTWGVPEAWLGLERCEKVEKIRKALRVEMDASHVCTRGIRSLLDFLAQRTTEGWRHLFLTTNWDFLLQREILSFIPDRILPSWLSDSHVFHINGTVEDSPDHPFRSPFLLTEDPESQRSGSTEANIAFNKMIWESTFVVIGMSFECATDRFLLQHLNMVEDDLPIGESQWVIVNPDANVLGVVATRIQAALPGASVSPVCRTLDQWLREGFGELRSVGVFSR